MSQVPQGTALRLKQTILWTAAALPFLLSLGFHTVSPVPQSSKQGQKRPALAFSQYLVNLGELPPGPYAFARFRFTNRGDKPIVIKELKPSCGCLDIRLDEREYEPGEAGEFAVHVQTTGEKPGHKEYYVDVLYDDPSPQQVQLVFKMILPKNQVVVRPRSLVFYQFNGQPSSRDIILTDFRSRPLNITGVESSSPLVTTEMLPNADADSKDGRELRVRVVVAGDVPPGRQHAIVTILTDDPSYPRFQIALRVEGLDRAKRRAIIDKEKVQGRSAADRTAKGTSPRNAVQQK